MIASARRRANRCSPSPQPPGRSTSSATPGDVAVSLAHHLGIAIDAAIEMMASADTRFGQTGDTHFGLQVRQRLGTWSEHVTSWLEAPIRRFSMRYEDMVGDPTAVFGALAAFLGWPASPEAVARAIASTHFDASRLFAVCLAPMAWIALDFRHKMSFRQG